MQDLIIRNAKIYDGTGKAAIQGDLAVSNGLITSIGQCGSPAKQEINADGLCLMPGIVDLHTHFDAQITWDKTLSPSPALGVTTAVMGNCGFGGLPMPSTIASEEELRALTNVLHEAGKGVFMMATGSRATPELMESIAAESGRPAYISTVLTMFNEANPSLAATYYEHAAQALKRSNELYRLTSCQPLSFDFTLLDPYVLLSHSAFDAIKSDFQNR